MTEISLDFLAEQQARVLGELRSLRSKIDEMRASCAVTCG